MVETVFKPFLHSVFQKSGTEHTVQGSTLLYNLVDVVHRDNYHTWVHGDMEFLLECPHQYLTSKCKCVHIIHTSVFFSMVEITTKHSCLYDK